MRIAFVLPFIVLAACQTVTDDTPLPAPVIAPETCGADRLQVFVGGPVGAAQQAAGQSITRVYAMGDPITLELLPERVNIVTDGQGSVLRIECG